MRPSLALALLVATLSGFGGTIALVVAAAAAVGVGLGSLGPLPLAFGLSPLVFVTPRFDPAVLRGLGVPLVSVTMAGQNLPGLTVPRAAGNPVPVGPILRPTGLAPLATPVCGRVAEAARAAPGGRR